MIRLLSIVLASTPVLVVDYYYSSRLPVATVASTTTTSRSRVVAYYCWWCAYHVLISYWKSNNHSSNANAQRDLPDSKSNSKRSRSRYCCRKQSHSQWKWYQNSLWIRVQLKLIWFLLPMKLKIRTSNFEDDCVGGDDDDMTGPSTSKKDISPMES